MGTREVKKKLLGYQMAKEEYQRLVMKIEEIETHLTSLSIDYSKEKVLSSTDAQAKLAKAIDELIKLKEDALAKAAEESRKMVEVYAMIESIDDTDSDFAEDQRKILHLRYIQGHEWEDVCKMVNLSWTNTHLKHRQALLILADKEA